MQTMRNMLIFAALFVLAALAPAGARPAAGPGALGEVKAVDVTLWDLELINQDGRKVKFKTDVVGDRVVVIIPFYTTCTTSYPILIYTFTRLQELLGRRLGKEVTLVSVSVDPRTDIPIRLKAFANRQKAGPGWVFLSGDKNNLAITLAGIGILFSSNLDEHNHTPFTVVGGAGMQWKRFYGYPSPELLLSNINTMVASPQRGGKSERTK